LDGHRMPKKPTPVAERRRESGNTYSVPSPGFSYNRPDSGVEPGAEPQDRGADVGR